VNYCTCQQPIHDAIGFIKCFEGGMTQEPTNWIQYEFETCLIHGGGSP
jgi:hypothetical protein